MSKEYFKVIPASFIILQKDDAVFLLRRFQTGYADGKYTMPSGHIEPNESLRAAAVREAKEECAVDIEASDLTLVHVLSANAASDGNHRVNFFFHTTKWSGEPTNAEPDKCDHADWFPINDLPADILPYVADTVGFLKTGQTYAEENWE